MHQFRSVPAAANGNPSITATGDDTNINLVLDGKGSGTVESTKVSYTSSTMTGLIDDAARTGKISSLPSAASQTPGGVSGYQKLLESKGYARIAGIVGRGVPILGTLLTGAFAANILLNDDLNYISSYIKEKDPEKCFLVKYKLSILNI